MALQVAFLLRQFFGQVPVWPTSLRAWPVTLVLGVFLGPLNTSRMLTKRSSGMEPGLGTPHGRAATRTQSHRTDENTRGYDLTIHQKPSFHFLCIV
jgi:hypothetical protein